MVFKPFAFQGESGLWEFPPNCMALCQGWGLWQECISAFRTHFILSIFSFACCIGFTQLAVGFLPQGIAPYAAFGVSLGRRELRRFLGHYLCLEPPAFIHFFMWLPVIACGTNLSTFGHVFHLIKVQFSMAEEWKTCLHMHKPTDLGQNNRSWWTLKMAEQTKFLGNFGWFSFVPFQKVCTR